MDIYYSKLLFGSDNEKYKFSNDNMLFEKKEDEENDDGDYNI